MGEEITRKLASIQEIVDVRPIPGADAIEVATVLGWDVVVKKGEYKVGDLAIYFEIDSFLPQRPEWDFLEKSCLRRMGEQVGLRLKTIRLRGQVSQGLLLPVNILHNPDNIMYPFPRDFISQLSEGDDLTELLGVVKWDPPLPAQLAGVARGNFPSFIPKTDQNRIQNIWRRNETRIKNDKWEVTVKLDGSSFTAYYNKETDTFGVCSRNMDLIESAENSFWQIARKYDLESKLRESGGSYAIQGELCGPGIQKNFEKLDAIDMFVFDIYDIEKQEYLTAYDRIGLVYSLGLKRAPLLHIDYEVYHSATLSDLLEMAEGESINRSNREGIVFKSLSDPNFSFKVISNSYLLKHEE